MRSRSSLFTMGAAREERPRWTFETSPSAPGRMHAEALALGKMCASEGAHETAPMSLPLGLVTVRQTAQMNSQRLTGAAPLLQSTLSLGLGGPATSTAARCMVMITQHMLAIPVVISALLTRLPSRALGAVAALQPWGRTASKFREEAVKFVDPK